MAKKKKLTKSELEAINKVIQTMNGVQQAIGTLELQKVDLLNSYARYNAELQEQQALLEEKYGSVNIDLTSGELTPIEDESK